MEQAKAVTFAAVLAAAFVAMGDGAFESGSLAGARPARGSASAVDEVWPTGVDTASVESGRYVTLSCSLLVYSRPEHVWNVIATVRTFSMWYPHWEPERDMLRQLEALGDTIPFFSDRSLAGKSVVTWIDPCRELRLVHELASGGKAGSIRITLQAVPRAAATPDGATPGEVRAAERGACGTGGAASGFGPAPLGTAMIYEETLPSSGARISREKKRVCKQAFLIKRLAEGE